MRCKQCDSQTLLAAALRGDLCWRQPREETSAVALRPACMLMDLNRASAELLPLLG